MDLFFEKVIQMIPDRSRWAPRPISNRSTCMLWSKPAPWNSWPSFSENFCQTSSRNFHNQDAWTRTWSTDGGGGRLLTTEVSTYSVASPPTSFAKPNMTFCAGKNSSWKNKNVSTSRQSKAASGRENPCCLIAFLHFHIRIVQFSFEKGRQIEGLAQQKQKRGFNLAFICSVLTLSWQTSSKTYSNRRKSWWWCLFPNRNKELFDKPDPICVQVVSLLFYTSSCLLITSVSGEIRNRIESSPRAVMADWKSTTSPTRQAGERESLLGPVSTPIEVKI